MYLGQLNGWVKVDPVLEQFLRSCIAVLLVSYKGACFKILAAFLTFHYLVDPLMVFQDPLII